MKKIILLIKCVIIVVLALMCAPIVMIDAVIGRNPILSFCLSDNDLSFISMIIEKRNDDVDEKDYDVAITILSKIVIVFYGTITSIVIIAVQEKG